MPGSWIVTGLPSCAEAMRVGLISLLTSVIVPDGLTSYSLAKIATPGPDVAAVGLLTTTEICGMPTTSTLDPSGALLQEANVPGPSVGVDSVPSWLSIPEVSE